MTKEQYEHERHCLELDEQAFNALADLCFEKHKKFKGVGVCAMCACGYCTQSGSVECRALRIALDLWRREKQRQEDLLLEAYTKPEEGE